MVEYTRFINSELKFKNDIFKSIRFQSTISLVQENRLKPKLACIESGD